VSEQARYGITATWKIYDHRMVRDRLLALVLRPTAPPAKWGVVTAAVLIAAEVVLVHLLMRVAPDNPFGAVFLLGVLVVSAGWGFALALATSLASTLAYAWIHVTEGSGSLVPAVAVFLTLALLTNVLVGQARLRAAEATQRRLEADSLAKQQTALRRVATLVARQADPDAIYPVAVAELARGLGVEHVTMLRYQSDHEAVVVACIDVDPNRQLSVGEQLSLSGDTVAGKVYLSGAPARVADYRDATGTTAARLRSLGLQSGVGGPVSVNGRTWGALVVGSARSTPIPAETESRVMDFADLVATAIFNTETRAELTASRARIVTAADQARRRFERDLHDGAQQRIVTLGLELRAIEASAPAGDGDLRTQLGDVIDGLSGLYADLQELSRGIHPAILSRGGLGPAIKTLARRSPVPVDLDLDLDGHLSESVEVAAYYVTAEALTNTAKYAEASQVSVRAAMGDGVLHLTITDDGIGGANADGGSGLVGLKDRVDALSGTLEVSSPSGGGTTVTAAIPFGTTG
jgi:signal transduction histidine kinase